MSKVEPFGGMTFRAKFPLTMAIRKNQRLRVQDYTKGGGCAPMELHYTIIHAEYIPSDLRLKVIYNVLFHLELSVRIH